ncbi:MAG TPA: branched-chain amino acid ABC transporter permease [Gammaproteobacteria bacterium]|nr:branched-chain amino acid ABC transporter permease [Gammaproteobacteria bacterium]
MRKFIMLAVIILIGLFSFLIPQFQWLSSYYQLVLMTIGINIILTLSLNLVNGFMGEFSVGHAGFMSIGAYVASVFSLHVFPENLFIISILSGGIAAAFGGVLIAILSFKTRGDYLAILTLAFLMIVKSIIENIQSIGGARGLSGISQLTTLPWVFFWLLVTFILMRNLVYSRFGRNILAIREDEMVARLMGVNTRQTKILAFAISAFFTGIAGGLYAHVLQFINPSMFNLAKSTDILIMVYLGGAGSLSGSIIGGTLYTLLMEILRPLATWRMVIMPIILILLMIFRPSGIMGYKEFSLFRPSQKYFRPKKALKA